MGSGIMWRDGPSAGVLFLGVLVIDIITILITRPPPFPSSSSYSSLLLPGLDETLAGKGRWSRRGFLAGHYGVAS
jgi:hypothetical protein